MRKYSTIKVVQIIFCLLSAAIAFKYVFNLAGTEFSGGQLTRSLLVLNGCGGIAFVASLIMILRHSNLAKIAAVFASVACLPLYLYFVAPGLFHLLGIAEYSVKTDIFFMWNSGAVFAILTLAITLFSCVFRSDSYADKS